MRRGVFAEFELNDGRNETFMINHEKCVLNLIKNPTGANEVLEDDCSWWTEAFCADRA